MQHTNLSTTLSPRCGPWSEKISDFRGKFLPLDINRICKSRQVRRIGSHRNQTVSSSQSKSQDISTGDNTGTGSLDLLLSIINNLVATQPLVKEEGFLGVGAVNENGGIATTDKAVMKMKPQQCRCNCGVGLKVRIHCTSDNGFDGWARS
nr:hypothetical protein Iba_chr06fCG1920 [Ipomoea batatas]